VRGLWFYLVPSWLLPNRGGMGHVAAEFLPERRCIIRINLGVISFGVVIAFAAHLNRGCSSKIVPHGSSGNWMVRLKSGCAGFERSVRFGYLPPTYLNASQNTWHEISRRVGMVSEDAARFCPSPSHRAALFTLDSLTAEMPLFMQREIHVH
jgi:hypothetical protein